MDPEGLFRIHPDLGVGETDPTRNGGLGHRRTEADPEGGPDQEEERRSGQGESLFEAQETRNLIGPLHSRSRTSKRLCQSFPVK